MDFFLYICDTYFKNVLLMKRFILGLLFGIGILVSFSSCVTSAYGQDVIVSSDEVDVVVRYGTPYYVDGSILYYMYRGWYYYPHMMNNHYYYHRYAKPLPHHRYIPKGRPVYNHRSSTYHNRPNRVYNRPPHSGHYHMRGGRSGFHRGRSGLGGRR